MIQINKKQMEMTTLQHELNKNQVHGQMQYQFKNLDRCDSEEIKEVRMQLSGSEEKEESSRGLRTDLNQLLAKIQAITNGRQENAIISSKNEIATKQGRQQNQPHKPRILTSSRTKSITRTGFADYPHQNQNRETMPSPPYPYARSSQPESASSNFYKYCTDQIVRVSNQNNSLSKQLKKIQQQLQNQKIVSQALRKQNNRLIKQFQQCSGKYSRRSQQVTILRQQLADLEREKIRKQMIQINDLTDKTKVYEDELGKYRRLASEKDQNNLRLIQEIKTLKLQSVRLIQISEENKRLVNKVSELINQNRSLQEKAAAKSEAVNHLWSIKQIQYGNIMGLISLSRQSPKPQHPQ